VKNLSSELSTVSKWYQLGIKLGLPPSHLHRIEREISTDIGRRIIEVVNLWWQSTPGASWRHIVTALREMGDMTTAERIESKYIKGTRGMTIGITWHYWRPASFCCISKLMYPCTVLKSVANIITSNKKHLKCNKI